MTTPAERLSSAEAAFLRAERDVEALLDALYDRWQDFEADTREINVYGVTASPAAAHALLMAGWRCVVQHEHTSREFQRCGCRRMP